MSASLARTSTESSPYLSDEINVDHLIILYKYYILAPSAQRDGPVRIHAQMRTPVRLALEVRAVIQEPWSTPRVVILVAAADPTARERFGNFLVVFDVGSFALVSCYEVCVLA